MTHATKNNIVLVSILAIGLLLGGCAFHPQRGTSTQYNGGTPNVPAQPQTDTPKAAPQNSEPDDSEISLSSPLPNMFASAWPREADLYGETSSPSKIGDDSFQDNDNSDTAEPAAETDAQSTIGDDGHDEDTDLWDRIREGFAFPDQQNTRIVGEAQWFSHHQAYLDRVAERAQPYLHYIVTQVEQRGMPSEIALLPIVESAFQPYAYSSGRAAGIWQFIPNTGRRWGLKLNWWYDGRRDIVASTRAALDYLEYLHNTFDGDWLLALAAYNSGEGTVLKAIHINQRRHKPTDYWSLRLPRETEQYVPRLLALRAIVSDPAKLGISLKPIADEPYLTSVKIDSQLDLAMAAKLADMDPEELHQLNPGFNRWATDPDGPHGLLLPLDKAAIFATQVAELSPEDMVRWVRHRVRHGETLGGIAHHYKTTVKVLGQLNKLKGHLIRPGQYLIIPISSNVMATDKAEHSEQNVSQEVPTGGDKTIHTVAEGDSLWALAHQYGTTVRQLSSWNHLNPRKALHRGQELIVGLGTTPNEAASNIRTSAASMEISKPRKITYTVHKGDSLARISQRFKVTVQQLRKWNDIKKDERIQPGQQLTLYVPLTADSERG